MTAGSGANIFFLCETVNDFGIEAVDFIMQIMIVVNTIPTGRRRASRDPQTARPQDGPSRQEGVGYGYCALFPVTGSRTGVKAVRSSAGSSHDSRSESEIRR